MMFRLFPEGTIWYLPANSVIRYMLFASLLSLGGPVYGWYLGKFLVFMLFLVIHGVILFPTLYILSMWLDYRAEMKYLAYIREDAYDKQAEIQTNRRNLRIVKDEVSKPD